MSVSLIVLPKGKPGSWVGDSVSKSTKVSIRQLGRKAVAAELVVGVGLGLRGKAEKLVGVEVVVGIEVCIKVGFWLLFGGWVLWLLLLVLFGYFGFKGVVLFCFVFLHQVLFFIHI